MSRRPLIRSPRVRSPEDNERDLRTRVLSPAPWLVRNDDSRVSVRRGNLFTTYNLPARQRGAYWRIPPAGARNRPSGAEVARSEFATPVAALRRADRPTAWHVRARERQVEGARGREGGRGTRKTTARVLPVSGREMLRRVLESGVAGGCLGGLDGGKKAGVGDGPWWGDEEKDEWGRERWL